MPLLFTSGVSPVLAIILFVYTAHLSYLTVRILPFMFRVTNYIKAAMMFILSYSLFMGVLASFGCDQSQLLTAIYVGFPISAVRALTTLRCRHAHFCHTHALTVAGNRRRLLPLHHACSYRRQESVVITSRAVP